MLASVSFTQSEKLLVVDNDLSVKVAHRPSNSARIGLYDIYERLCNDESGLAHFEPRETGTSSAFAVPLPMSTSKMECYGYCRLSENR